MNTSGTDYRWDYLRVDDVGPWSTLIEAVATADHTDEHAAPQDLAEGLRDHGFDPASDTFAVRHGEDLIGWAQVRVSHSLTGEGRARAWLSGGVHPSHRGRGVGREVFERSEARAVRLAAQRHRGAHVSFRVNRNLAGDPGRKLLQHRGYLVVRYFNQMTCTLPTPAKPGVVPERAAALTGFTVKEVHHQHSDDMRKLHNIAFRDHWGTIPLTREKWDDYWSSRRTRLQMSSVAIDDDAQMIGYVLCEQERDRVLHLNIVGTHPSARGRGVATACMRHTLDLAASAGQYDTVELQVDSASLTGANRLYTQLGFTQDKAIAVYEKAATA